MKKILAISLISVFALMTVLLTSGTVNAQAAQCFKKEGENITLEQCDDFFATAAAFFFGRSSTRGGSLLDDKCYMAKNGTLIEKDFDSPECTRWRSVATDNRAAGQAQPDNSGGGGGGAPTGRFTCSGDACVNDNPITKFVIAVINLLSAAVGIITVAVIVVAGIQYTTSGGNPQAAAQAKKRIINAVIALVAFFFLYGILDYLLIGGIFK